VTLLECREDDFVFEMVDAGTLDEIFTNLRSTRHFIKSLKKKHGTGLQKNVMVWKSADAHYK